MNWTVKLTNQAKKDLIFWKKSNKSIFNECVELLRFLEKDPLNLQTKGNPEWLKGNLSGCMSRKITKKDRCVYEIIKKEKVIKVLQLRFHYDDR